MTHPPLDVRSAIHLDYSGKFVSSAPIGDGAAFNCDPCKATWQAAQIDSSGSEES